MKFQRKRGSTGWPGPQVRLIISKAERWGLQVSEDVASTGTRYLTISDGDSDAEITVRVADHSDAYARADYTVDPYEDDRCEVYAWIEAHGECRKRRSRRPWSPFTRINGIWFGAREGVYRALDENRYPERYATDEERQVIDAEIASIAKAMTNCTNEG